MEELRSLQNKKNRFPGQSYVEIIAAVGLVALALLVLVRLKVAQIKLGEQTNAKTTAFNLAVEGLEIAESLRLDQRIRRRPQPHSLSEGNWVVDYESAWPNKYDKASDSNISKCTNCYLCRQSDDSFLKCPKGTTSPFKRMISVVDVNTTTTQITSKVLYFEKTWKPINLTRTLIEWSQNEI